ncbi:MAG: hypothetical protein JSS11_16335 [Verrucomicrobia bacterium]|nr:hypothetical protein [Verrucomicrobiota bacterium]
MRRFVFLLLGLLVVLPLRAAAPPLLDAALKKFFADYDRWAFTQNIVEKDDKGKVVSEAVVRFDPSQPYEKQYVPLLVDGKTPTEKQLKKYRKQGEKRGNRAEKAEKEGKEVRQSLGELMDIDRATVYGDDGKTITFEVPLKKEGNKRLPPEKFLVLVKVGKESQAFESVTVNLREAMRAALVVKVKKGAGQIAFAVVDPKFAPAIVSIHGEASGSVMFISVGRDYDVKLTDFKRVKPYAERFGVQLGPLKALDF